jgi:hypothetical protein
MSELNDLIHSIGEIKSDVKWLVNETKRINGSIKTHIENGDEVYRPQIEANSRFRKIVCRIGAWIIGTSLLGWASVIVLVIREIGG